MAQKSSRKIESLAEELSSIERRWQKLMGLLTDALEEHAPFRVLKLIPSRDRTLSVVDRGMTAEQRELVLSRLRGFGFRAVNFNGGELVIL
jgi:hypothetical protein